MGLGTDYTAVLSAAPSETSRLDGSSNAKVDGNSVSGGTAWGDHWLAWLSVPPEDTLWLCVV